MARPIEKRDTIVRSALEVFVEKGVDGTTIQDIANHANAAGGTLYRYFRSKEELAQSIFFENLSLFMSELKKAILKEKHTKQKLYAMVDKFYNFFENDKVLYSYLLLSEHNFAKKMTKNYQTPVDLIIEVINNGVAKKEIFSKDSVFAAAFVYGAVVRITYFKIYGRIHEDLSIYKNRVVEGCWAFLQNE
ncbi:TetR/AcrR family transcriptional regulator [Candidatus Uabimicrobium sp. HlEnr_7]|uniref:TetR/AcrR family transcriptional regulator n=1 Tax=Candidatus Uabimicrobium helgolandensis TaxID=3095367 RepID=UPI00355801FE